MAAAPLGDATQGSPGNQGLYTGAAALAVTNNFQQSQDTLYALAGDSGGKAFFDNNDLTLGIVHAQQAVSDYYILGYYTSNTAKNGNFRRIKISMTNGLEDNLNYREGYYAEKEFAKFNEADKERQLEDALMLEVPITDLTIAMEIDYFQLNRAEYFVPISVKIPGRELALAKRGGAQQTSIDFIGEIKDTVGGFTVQNIRDHVSKKLSDATAAELAKVPIEYDAGYTLLPGRYMIKFLARDDETGRIGTFQATFTIPNLNKVRRSRGDEFGGSEQPARGFERRTLRHRKGQGTQEGRSRESARRKPGQTDPQRDPRLLQGARNLRLFSGLQANSRLRHTAALRIHHSLPKWRGGVRNATGVDHSQRAKPPRRHAPQFRSRRKRVTVR